MTSIIDQINDGSFDESLEKIKEAVTQRQMLLRKTRGPLEFALGDRVRFNDYCGTKYLQGMTAEVIRIDRTKLVVTLDKPMGRFIRRDSAGNVKSAEVKVPPSIVDLVK